MLKCDELIIVLNNIVLSCAITRPIGRDNFYLSWIPVGNYYKIRELNIIKKC
ncbi:hypothetical protein Shell_1056 [Staphylothermus hellenicus DSM 12710]|uniref:Uncharacterized protein n=1 Tax=Staphylothermus hellenicus (strain DSM 12710 / JCM 10830 / BK20S6-10-b1 / P8) TaxID=591019 RepID=D7D8R4_STAHD|nr:hypothetical protein Shell_1056 [Staphylothermus hellenicus DSM 12710]